MKVSVAAALLALAAAGCGMFQKELSWPEDAGLPDSGGVGADAGEDRCRIATDSFAAGAPNPANVCQVCTPATSPTTWSNAPMSTSCAEDDLSCTGDTCDGAGACQHPVLFVEPDSAWADWLLPPEAPTAYTYTGSSETVVDQVTGLTWRRAASGDATSWDLAKASCEKLDAPDGGAGWRLPTVIELLSIVDNTRVGPCINVDAFPDTPSEHFWTSTPYAGSANHRWIVHFHDGFTFHDGAAGPYRARCVR